MSKASVDFKAERAKLARALGLDYAEQPETVYWQENKQCEQAREALRELEKTDTMQQADKDAPEAIKTDRPQTPPEEAGRGQEALFTQGLRPQDAAAVASGLQAEPVRLPWSVRLSAFVKAIGDFARSRRQRSKAGEVESQKLEKNRQVQRTLAAAGALVAGAAVLVVFFSKSPAVGRESVRVYHSDFRLEPQALDKQSYQQRYEEKLAQISQRLRAAEDAARRLENALQEQAQAHKKVEERTPAPEVSAVPVNALPDFSQGTSAQASGLAAAMGAASVVDDAPRLARVSVSDPEREREAIRTAAREVTRRRALADAPIAANRARHEAAGTYLPAGSFARAVVLAGATVSTGGTAASNPVPMLLEVKDLARLPNAFRADVKACFVTANATGDLSSERVWIRLERLSCMTREGRAFDARIQGYVTGDDGKTGVRARLVTRSGQAIANALLAGSISGLGKAVSLSAQSSTTYTSGAVGTTVSDSFRAGLGEGMQSALDRIADYYIRLADKIFPCLEVDSGRRVDLILSQGVGVELEETRTKTEAGGPSRTEYEINNSEVFNEELRAQSGLYR